MREFYYWRRKMSNIINNNFTAIINLTGRLADAIIDLQRRVETLEAQVKAQQQGVQVNVAVAY